jgi:starch synthase
MKMAVDYSDGVIFGDKNINAELKAYVEKSGKPILEHQEMENYISAFSEFYDKVLLEESVVSR